MLLKALDRLGRETPTVVVDVLTATCFIAGALFAFIGALGLHRLADTRSRMHAAT
ncbi:MAG: hypothetical protein EBX15_04135, partial [Acidimicrobiia bacterium]|nr:hypothetical protein [Acidimicrobiia bacterium]